MMPNSQQASADTLADEMMEWLFSREDLHLHASTVSSYRTVIQKHLRPILQECPSDSLDGRKIGLWVEALRKQNLSDSQLAKIKAVLHGFLKTRPNSWALLPPLSNLNHKNGPLPCAHILSCQEQQRLEHAAFSFPHYSGLGILIALHTGVRAEELCDLTWRDVDCETQTLWVCRTARLTHQPAFSEAARIVLHPQEMNPHQSCRAIPLDDALYRLLCQCRCGRAVTSQYIVCNRKGERTKPHSYSSLLHRALKKAELKPFSFSVLRTTFAARALESGMDVKTLSELLGTSNSSIPLNLYCRSKMERNVQGIQQLNRYYHLKIDHLI